MTHTVGEMYCWRDVLLVRHIVGETRTVREALRLDSTWTMRLGPVATGLDSLIVFAIPVEEYCASLGGHCVQVQSGQGSVPDSLGSSRGRLLISPNLFTALAFSKAPVFHPFNTKWPLFAWGQSAFYSRAVGQTFIRRFRF